VSFGCASGQRGRQNYSGAESNVYKQFSEWINCAEDFLQTACGQASMKPTSVSMSSAGCSFEHADNALGCLKGIHF
jgi:hypothetical protein